MQRRTTLYVVGAIIVIAIVIVVAYVLLRSSQVEIPGEPGRSPTADEAAQNSLETLRKLVNQSNSQPMGFDTPGDVMTAELGKPLSVFVIPLDKLQAYAPQTTDPESLLVDLNRMIYPVTVNGEVRSAVTVEHSEGGWVGTDFGGTNLIMALENTRKTDKDFVVQVPALNLYFMAGQGEDGLQFTPITDDPRFTFTAGRTQKADEVLSAILPVAQAQKDVPG